MKFVFIAACLMLLTALQVPVAYAKQAQEVRIEADQYYLESNFKKAYKLYFKLAKKGDHHSQDRIAQMYVKGEGKPIDLTEAYAWSVLAAESGEEKLVNGSDELLLLTNDKTKAEKRATSLKKKYGKVTLARKAAKQAERDSYKKSGVCTGSSLGCARG
jgi:TPR repeat protein